MIIYDLECDTRHRFEGWFKNAEEFTQQQGKGMLTCPICGSESVRKLPSVSHIGKGLQPQVTSPAPGTSNGQTLHQYQALKLMHDYINKHFDDVGNRFAEEVKKIHYGESEQRNIRGTATADQIRELRDEGVETIRLTPAPYDKDKLN